MLFNVSDIILFCAIQLSSLTLTLFQYVLTPQVIGGNYYKWIVVLQEFYLDFPSAKSKKSLVFSELMS
jgi:hypothetical protein